MPFLHFYTDAFATRFFNFGFWPFEPLIFLHSLIFWLKSCFWPTIFLVFLFWFNFFNFLPLNPPRWCRQCAPLIQHHLRYLITPNPSSPIKCGKNLLQHIVSTWSAAGGGACHTRASRLCLPWRPWADRPIPSVWRGPPHAADRAISCVFPYFFALGSTWD